jgi:hypothetical protein
MSLRTESPRTTIGLARLTAALAVAALLIMSPSWGQQTPPPAAEPAPPKDEAPAKEPSKPENPSELREALKELQQSLKNERGRIERDVRESVDRAIDDLREALKDDKISSDEVRRALERVQEDFRRTLEQSGLPRPPRPKAQRRREERREEAAARNPNRAEDSPDRTEARAKAREEVRRLEEQLRLARERLFELEGIPSDRLRSRLGPPPRRFEFQPPPPSASPFNLDRGMERRFRELQQQLDRMRREFDELREQRKSAPRPKDDEPV